MGAATDRRIEKSLARATLVGVGLVAGGVAGAIMATWQMAVGAIADAETAVAGIESSTWTPVTSITSFLFGLESFHESFAYWPVVLGIIVHMAISMILGVAGAGLIVGLLGKRPGPLAAATLGVIFGLVVEVVQLNLIVNSIQDVDTVYTSTPRWSWWAAHALFGMTLGLVASGLLSRSRRVRALSGSARPGG